MRKVDLRALNIQTEHGIFTPKYMYDSFDGNEYKNLVIEKTAEEVYKEYLKKKQIDICPSKTTEEKLEEAEQRIIELETQLEEQTNVNIEQDELIISILENVEG
nr:MAG TPA: hypothetical protein [Caudoviricetes sp.]